MNEDEINIWHVETIDGKPVYTKVVRYLEIGIDWAREVSVFFYFLEDDRKLVCNIPLPILRNIEETEKYLFDAYKIIIEKPNEEKINFERQSTRQINPTVADTNVSSSSGSTVPPGWLARLFDWIYSFRPRV